jgi:hypothetical protein
VAEKVVTTGKIMSAGRMSLMSSEDREFEFTIRQQPADHTAVRRYTIQPLRDATDWREILGPPASPKEESRD